MVFVSHAQNFEDVMLWRALKHVEDGFYLDVGAAWPQKDSVTKSFYDRGWRGINVEPNLSMWQLLAAERTRDINLKQALSDQAGERAFHVFPDTGLSTLDADIAVAHAADGFRTESANVQIATLSEIWREHVGSRAVHFLKVDVEGHERQVLSGNDWKLNRPWIVVIEATRPMSSVKNHHEWEPIVLDAGYRLAYDDGLNRFYVAGEHAELLPAFSAPPNVFDEFIVAPQFNVEVELLQSLEDRAKRSKEAARVAQHRAKGLEVLAARWQERATAAEEQSQRTEERVSRLERALQRAESRTRTAVAAADRQRARRRRMKASLSWRITKPLRWITRWFRRDEPPLRPGDLGAAGPKFANAPAAAIDDARSWSSVSSIQPDERMTSRVRNSLMFLSRKPRQ